MKLMKRFTSVLLVLCMVLSLVPAITFGASAASYTKATSIAVGDTVVFVCESVTKELTSFSTTSTIYGISTAYTGSPAGTMTFEVVSGSSSGTYAFKNGSNYVTWTSGNSLKTSTSFNANSSWNVTFDADGNAVIKNAADATRQLQYNSGSPRFACYTSTQTAVQLYKGESSGAACTHANTTLTGVVAATCTSTGYTGDVVCNDCGVTVTTGSTTAKIDHNYVDGTCTMCGAADPPASTGDYSGRYYIAAIRTGSNYYYMTNDLGTASTKRYTAVDSGLTTLPASITSAEANKIFVLQKNADGTYLLYAEGISGDNKYLGYTSGNSGTLVAVASALNLTVTPNGTAYNIHFAASDAERYLALNASTGSDYFAWYKSGQKQDLTLIPVSGTSSCSHTNTTTTTVDATCTTPGSTTETCNDCGQTLSTITIPVIAHNYVDGTCSVCGATDPNYNPGGGELESTSFGLTNTLSNGDYVIGALNGTAGADNNIQAMNYTVDGGWLKYATTTPADGIITTEDLSIVWTLELQSGGGFTLKNKSTGKYLTLGTGTGSGSVTVTETATVLYASAVDSTGATFEVHPTSSSTNVLACNQGSGYGYRMYADKDHATSATGIATLIRFYKSGATPVGDGSGGTGGGESGGETGDTTVATIKIITGIGKAWFVDGEGNQYALRDDNHNPLGTEATEKAKVYRADVPTNGTITLVLQPDATQRLACIEKGSDRLESSAYTYDSTNGYFTYTFTATTTTTTGNYFRITFLPRLADGGYTAVQATESATGAAITPGIYVMTGLRTPETYTTNAHSVDTTYLLYADTDTAVDDSYAAVGRKSSALQLSSVGVFLNTEDPYLMTAVNQNHLVNIQTSGDHYTIGLVGAEGYYLKAISGNNLNATNNLSDSGVLWDITYLSDGAYEIVNVDTGRTLLFNSTEANLQFRAYNLADSSLKLAENAPVLYRAAKASQLVTYTVTSGTGTGSIYANNNSTASAVASGTYQTIDSQLTFTFTPAYGYQLDSVTVNGETVTLTDGTYTCTVVEGTDIHVEASYSEIPENRNITVNYYVNGELKQTVTTLASHVYTLDIASLNPVTVNGVEYTYSELSFTRAENGTAVYSSLQAAIAVKDGDVINAYFSTTAVNLDKTATETTDKNTTVNDANGGLNSENFTDTNDTDPHGNVKQTYEITLNAQSFSKGQDIIEGNTDVIVVLDNSNSMHFKDGPVVSGYLREISTTESGFAIESTLSADTTLLISVSSDYTATITTQGSPYNTIAFDPDNEVFGFYPQGHGMENVCLLRRNSSTGKYSYVNSLSSLANGDTIVIANYSVTHYLNATVMDNNGMFASDSLDGGIDTSMAFTIVVDTSEGLIAFHAANTTVGGMTNSEYTMDALDGFYDRVFSDPGNRVGLVKFNAYGYIWNGSSYLPYSDSVTPGDYTDVTYENCYLTSKTDAMNASWEAIGTMEEDDGATNFVGAWLMTYLMAMTRDTATDRNLVIVFFTDGQPTVSYEFTGDLETGDLWWNDNNTDMHPIAASGSNVSGGLYTSAGEYYYAMEIARAVKADIEDNYPSGVSIHNVALLNDADLDVELVNWFMSNEASVARQWYYGYTSDNTEVGYHPLTKNSTSTYYLYGDVSNYKGAGYWYSITPYADSYAPVVGDVSNSLNDAFNAIATTITPGKVVEGTIEDTIPADFVLTPESEAELEAAGWTVTVNADGTTTLFSPTVKADEDGESFTYEIQYQGDGYGAVYTNVQAKYIYEGIDDETESISFFPMPVVDVIPWTVNDGYTADTNVAVTLDVMKNDLFEELTAGGYIVGNLTVTLTDANGTPTTYLGAQVGAFDAVVDPASNTVSFVTEVGGNSTFYYVVSAEVTATDGTVTTVTTVYSRATRVDVLTVSAENVSDVDVVMVGDSATVDLLANDTFESGDYTTENSVVLTDANGNELTSSTIGILTNVSVNEDTGVLTYTAAESGVEQFWYVNTVTATDSGGNPTTTPPTKVTILVVDDAVLVVDYGYTTEALQVHADLTAYTVADGVTLADVVDVTYPAANGTYGAANFNNGAFTFTPATTMFGGLDVFTYTVEITKNTYNVRTATYEPTVTVVPANSVHYEESFLNYATTGVDLNNNALTTWSDEGTADTRDQSTANKLYGYDSVYATIESYSGNSAKVATVTETNPTAVAYFSFTGTGFDLYGLSSQDTGFLLAEIYTYDASEEDNHNLGTIKKYVMVDTYIQGKTYEQLPILGCRDLPYGSYAVKLRVVYEKAFDHNLPAAKNEGIKNEDYYRRLLGLQAGVPMELSLNETKAPATRTVPTATLGSYSIVLDGIRIYQPLDASPADTLANSLYSEAGELGANFYRVRDLLLSADAWADAEGKVSGLVYIAADAAYTGAANQDSAIDTGAPATEGVYLTPTQSYKLDENNYLVDPATGKRAVINVDGTDYEIYVVVVDGVEGGRYYEYRYNNGSEEVVISHKDIESMGLMHTNNYYEAVGPKYELYLTNGNGIAFNVGTGKLLHLSMKLPVGETATLQAYVGGQWIDAATVSSRTELYYDLSSCVNADGSVILKCAASDDAVLSLCNVKTMAAPDVSRSAVYTAAAAINGLKEQQTEVSFKMGHSVSFESDLKMNYRVKYSDLAALVPNYVAEGAYLVVEKDRYPAGDLVRIDTVILSADLTSDPDRMIFVLDGIQAAEMGSELRATLHFFDAQGREHVAPVDTYSILAYTQLCLDTYEDPALYTMLIDLLNYGAAAQVYFNRNTKCLVNAGMDAYQQYATKELSAELTAGKVVLENSSSISAVSAMGFSVNFADRTELNAKLTLAKGYTAKDITCVKVLDQAGNVVDTLTDFTTLADGRLQATFRGIRSVQMRETFYFVAYVGETAASSSVGYSVEAYAKSIANSGDAALNEMVRRCIYFGDAAKAYFG